MPRPAADNNLCKPSGKDGAIALPRKLATANRPQEDKYTTADVEPLNSVNIDALGLRTPRTLTVGTQPGGPPTSCLNSAGRYTGYDNELLRAIAAKLGLQVVFAGTEFSGLLAQVAARRFDVGSSSIMATEARRRTVGFTNGYDFGYLSLIVPSGSPIDGFEELARGQRIGVVQGTVEEAYVVDTLHIEPVKFPDFTTVYTSVKTHQIDAWVAPAMEAANVMRPGDTAAIAAYTFGLGNFVAYAVSKDNQPLIAALNAGLDAVIADGTWSQLYTDWVPRPLPRGWKPGSKSAPTPHLPDFAAIAERNHRTVDERRPAEVDAGAAAGLVLRLGSLQAGRSGDADDGPAEHADPDRQLQHDRVGARHGAGGCGISRARWLRWPARVYTDIFRGLPEVVIILLIGLGIGPLVGGLTGNNPYPLGIAALGLMAAAYVGEIFRSGIQSVEPGQLEAPARWGSVIPPSMRLVVMPQGIRRVLPALVNQFIALLKGSRWCTSSGLIAGQRELFQVGRDLNAQTGSLSPLVAAGLFYLLLTIPLTHLVNYIDARLRHGRPSRAGGSARPAPDLRQEMT